MLSFSQYGKVESFLLNNLDSQVNIMKRVCMVHGISNLKKPLSDSLNEKNTFTRKYKDSATGVELKIFLVKYQDTLIRVKSACYLGNGTIIHGIFEDFYKAYFSKLDGFIFYGQFVKWNGCIVVWANIPNGEEICIERR
jgi:hypothetical protein